MRKRVSHLPFLMGCLCGVLMGLAALLWVPVYPATAVGFAVCDQLIGVVVSYSDGSSRALAPMESTDEDVEKLMADAQVVPPERRGLIQLSSTCGQKQRT